MIDEEIQEWVNDFIDNIPDDELVLDLIKAGLFDKFKDHLQDINNDILKKYLKFKQSK